MVMSWAHCYFEFEFKLAVGGGYINQNGGSLLINKSLAAFTHSLFLGSTIAYNDSNKCKLEVIAEEESAAATKMQYIVKYEVSLPIIIQKHVFSILYLKFKF
jgi:hypothetical protein